MELAGVLHHWGLALVFVVVLVDLGGLPLPATPLLVIAGAVSVEGSLRAELVLLAAFAAALMADHMWFFVGRRHGRKLLETVCRISLSPDICVNRTDELLGRYGPSLLLFAKFMPGVSAVSIPTMAAMGVKYGRFIRYDAAGCLIWCGTYIGAGLIFSREIDRVLDTMSWLGSRIIVVIAALLALYIGAKLWHRRRLMRLHGLVRIAPREVAAFIEEGSDFVILDARSQVARSSDPRVLPKSMTLEDPTAIEALPLELREKIVVTFCTCPNEASAAFVADLLIKAGYSRVRVLTGGTDALDALAR